MKRPGERWRLSNGERVTITADLANGFVRVLNERGFLEVIHENMLRDFLNAKEFPDKKGESCSLGSKSPLSS